jgi:hypothetical protein
VEDAAAGIALVIVGALAGAVPTVYLDRVRGLRERREQFADLHRELFTSFLGNISSTEWEALALHQRLAATESPGPNQLPDATGFTNVSRAHLDPERIPEGPARQSAQQVARLRDELTPIYQGIKLTAPDEAIAAAKRAIQAVNGLVDKAIGADPANSAKEIESYRSVLEETRNEVRKEARRLLAAPPEDDGHRRLRRRRSVRPE